jgi:hypothetical protein
MKKTTGRRLRRFVAPLILIGCLAAGLYYLERPVEPTGGHPPRRLVLIVDGVPFAAIAKMCAEGRFQAFKEPARMIATFPSLTNLSIIEILGAPDSPGYEDHYYDRELNRLVGGIPDRLRGGKFIDGSFRRQFDYHAAALKGALAYLVPPYGGEWTANSDLEGFVRAFRASRDSNFLGYIGETDPLAHLAGEESLDEFLRSLDTALDRLIRESDGELEIDICSDHGNLFSNYRQVRLNEAIERHGFVVEKSLSKVRGVVLPRYGMIGCAMLFTAPELRQSLAEACTTAEGVDFAAYQDGDAIEVVSTRGRARVTRHGNRFRYEAQSGDPLLLLPVVDHMRASGQIDGDGFMSEDAWFSATLNHRYVDPLRRLFDGFTAHVRSRADVIASLENGWYIGSPFLDKFATMRATHGSLMAGETEGFAMSTRRSFGTAVRGAELHNLFLLDEFQKRSAIAQVK